MSEVLGRFANFPNAPTWYEFWRDFDNEQDIDAFTGTALASGTGAVTVDAAYGVYRIANNASDDNSGFQIQGDMETFTLLQGKQTDFTCRATLSVVDESEFYCGLSITDTTIIDGGGTLAIGDLTPSDQVGFYKPDGSANIYGTITRDSVLSATGALGTLTAATAVTLSFSVVMDPNTAGKGYVIYYINGVPVGRLDSTTMPYSAEEVLTPSVAYNSGTTSAQTCDIDFVGARQQR